VWVAVTVRRASAFAAWLLTVPLCATENVGDVGFGPVLAVALNQYRPLARRQRGEQLPHRVPLVDGIGNRLRIGPLG
jgi:hypothetical protein